MFAQIIIRNIEPAVKALLKRRAKRHGRTLPEEIRTILRDAVKKERRRVLATRKVWERVLQMNLLESALHPRRLPSLSGISTFFGADVGRKRHACCPGLLRFARNDTRRHGRLHQPYGSLRSHPPMRSTAARMSAAEPA